MVQAAGRTKIEYDMPFILIMFKNKRLFLCAWMKSA